MSVGRLARLPAASAAAALTCLHTLPALPFVTRRLQVTNRPGQDNLAMAAIRFLTTVARSVHCKLFADPAVLKQICESIILPNLRVSCSAQWGFWRATGWQCMHAPRAVDCRAAGD